MQKSVIAFAWVVIGGSTSDAQSRLQVRTDPQHVVASRLVGEWEPNAVLTTRLGGRALAGGAPGSDDRVGGRVVFKSDSSVAGRIPAAMATVMLREEPALQVYLAGTVTFGGRDHPFLLITIKGNTQMLYFRPRGGDPYGDGESFILSLAPAKEPMNDLLFIGGDFNNQPFSAYQRVGPGGSDGEPRR
jgi:hypothetical protein